MSSNNHNNIFLEYSTVVFFAIILIVIIIALVFSFSFSTKSCQSHLKKLSEFSNNIFFWSQQNNNNQKFASTIVLSKEPQIIILPHFLSTAECQHLIRLSEQIGLSRSTVQGKTHEISSHRTSYTTSLKRQHDQVVRDIEQRVSELTKFPLAHIENLQVVRYEKGQQYKHHYDFFVPGATGTEEALQNGSQRYITFFVYLNNLPTLTSGLHGYTDFPKIPLQIQPQQGAAVIWMNVDASTGKEDYRTYHAGMPPQEGIKYGLNIWIRAQPFFG
jgi:prolyl 4-hydroxylase